MRTGGGGGLFGGGFGGGDSNETTTGEDYYDEEEDEQESSATKRQTMTAVPAVSPEEVLQLRYLQRREMDTISSLLFIKKV